MRFLAAWWEMLLAKGNEYMETRETKLSMMHTIALWGNVAVTICTLCVVVWKGGMMNERVDSHDKRLDRIEISGTGGLKAHEGLDDQRIKAIEERLRKLEDAILTLSAIKADVAEIKTSVEFLTGKRTIPKP